MAVPVPIRVLNIQDKGTPPPNRTAGVDDIPYEFDEVFLNTYFQYSKVKENKK